MRLTAHLRKLALTAHVTSSVGWFGAVATFLALAVAGLTSDAAALVRATYLAMNVIGWCVIVPLSLASLPTGIVMSVGTEWGLFRHYWIVAKLAISVVATILLLVHMEPVGHLADVVTQATLHGGELAGMRVQLVADAGAALVALLVATALSVYKPRGMTAYGRRQQRGPQPGASGVAAAAIPATPRWVLLCGAFAALLVLLFAVAHLTSRGLGGH